MYVVTITNLRTERVDLGTQFQTAAAAEAHAAFFNAAARENRCTHLLYRAVWMDDPASLSLRPVAA